MKGMSGRAKRKARPPILIAVLVVCATLVLPMAARGQVGEPFPQMPVTPWAPSGTGQATGSPSATPAPSGRGSGRKLMITGFVLLGLGATLWVVTSVPLVPDATAKDNPTADVVFGVTAALGLAVAVYGIVKMTAQTDTETEAMNRRQYLEASSLPIFPPGHPRGPLSGAVGRSLGVSLLSFAF